MIWFIIFASLFLHGLSMDPDQFKKIWEEREKQGGLKMIDVKPNDKSPNVKIKALIRPLHDKAFRIEAYEAIIKNPLPPSGTRKNTPGANFGSADTKYMKKYLNATGDDENGHVLGYAIGGPTTRENLFPQHKCCNRNCGERHLLTDWFGMEGEILEHMKKYKNGRAEVRVVFDFPGDNRPKQINTCALGYTDGGVLAIAGEYEVTNGPGFFATKTAAEVKKTYGKKATPPPGRRKREDKENFGNKDCPKKPKSILHPVK